MSFSGSTSDIVSQASDLVDSINYQNNQDGEPQGWETLKEILAEVADFHPSDAELKKSWRPQNKDWCGIFAIYCYKKAGVSVSWSLVKGSPVGEVQKMAGAGQARADFESGIQEGDIVVFEKNSHHALVESPGDDGKLNTIDGNQAFGQILRRSDHLIKDVVAYYRAV